MRASLFFRWFDLWIGAYVDTANRTLYVCPIPMFGIKIRWGLTLGDAMDEHERRRCTHEGIGAPGCPTCDPRASR